MSQYKYIKKKEYTNYIADRLPVVSLHFLNSIISESSFDLTKYFRSFLIILFSLNYKIKEITIIIERIKIIFKNVEFLNS